MAFKFSILIVANRTAQSEDLLDALRAHAERRPTHFTLLVPAQAPGPDSREAAQATLDATLERMRGAGLEVAGGRVGRPDAVGAVRDFWDPREFDEVIVSTLPGQESKWLEVDVPHRIAKFTGVQVTHVLSAEPKKQGVRGPAPKHEKQGVLSPLSVLSWGGSSARDAGNGGDAKRSS
jgi:GABA permease